jgi:dienelactone hydrolase
MRNLFKISCFIIALLSPTGMMLGQGQLLLQENFVMPTTDLTTLGWTTVTGVGASTAPPYVVVNPGTALTYTGYIESGVGNAAFCSGAGQDVQKAFTDATTGTVYLSFLIKVDSASTSGDYFMMIRNTSNHNRWRFWLKNSNAGANFEFGVGKGSATQLYTNSQYVFGTTYLVVCKYDFRTTATTDAEISLWVNPASSSFGKAEDATPVISKFTDAASSTADFLTINRFALIMNGVGTAPTFSIGGVRMATDWKTALPPSPMYYNFSGTGDITNPANWGPNLDGTGTSPSDFASDNQWYLLRNATPSIPRTVTINSDWTISGSGSKLIVGAGTNVVLGSGRYLSGTVDVAATGTLSLQPQDNFNWPIFGSIAGTVFFDNPAGFTLTGNQTLPASSGYYILKNGNLNVGSLTLTVKGRLRCSSNTVTGAGTFMLDSAGTLGISSAAGITGSGASGDIQTGTRKFSRYGNYEYLGQTDQVTGNGIPDTVSNLTVAMGGRNLSTTLTKPVVVTPGNLGMTAGKFRLGNYNLTFSNPANQSDSSYVITDGSGALIRTVANTGVKTLPLGSPTEYRRVAITFESAPAGGTRYIAFRYVTGDTASAGFPPGITYRYKGGYWEISSDSATGATFRLDVTTPFGFGDTTSLRIIRRPDKTTAWDTVGTVGSFAVGLLSQAGIDRFGQFAIGVGASAPPPPPGKRYQSEVFESYQLQSDVQFGQAPSKTLYLDLYTATGDTVKNRPLVIFIHGGGFQGGDKVSGFGTLVCGGLAKRGYVVASINYRITSPIANDAVHFESMLRALQDTKAAVRFFRKNGAAYGVDTSQIFATGSSAGSITALHLAYLDSAEVPGYVTWSNVDGTFEGTSGNPGFSSRIQGVVSNWGAIGDTAWMKKGDVPVYSVHGTSDSTVFYDLIPADGPFRYSSKYVTAAAQQKGIPNGLRLFYNTGHTLDNSAAKQDSALRDFSAWLYTILKAGTVSVQDVPSPIPTSILLHQNFPNPFNPATKIAYGIPAQMKVSLEVYNLLGQHVATLVDHVQSAGFYEVTFDATQFASGIYFYRLATGNAVFTKKMMVLK